jgi:hypothetical protein
MTNVTQLVVPLEECMDWIVQSGLQLFVFLLRRPASKCSKVSMMCGPFAGPAETTPGVGSTIYSPISVGGSTLAAALQSLLLAYGATDSSSGMMWASEQVILLPQVQRWLQMICIC